MAHGVNYFAEKKSASKKTDGSVPKGFTRLDAFNASINKNSKYGGLKDRVVNDNEIWVMEYKGKILLWWEKPKLQIDDFVYTGSSKRDIDDCNAQMARQMGNLDVRYTWHHTGYPPEETHGTMQLVPTDEHESLTHIGGAAISQGKY